MSTENNQVQSAPNALTDFTSCPDWGKGGQYIYDPETGKRTRVEPPTEPAVDAAADQQQAAPAAQPETLTVKKERSRA